MTIRAVKLPQSYPARVLWWEILRRRPFGGVAPKRVRLTGVSGLWRLHGEMEAFYVGPDRQRHTSGLTFSNLVNS